MAKFFLVVEPSCLKMWVLKSKCAVKNIDWNNLTFELLGKDEQNLIGTTRNFRTFQSLKTKEINNMFLTYVF